MIYFHLFIWILFQYFILKLKSQTIIYSIPNNNTPIIISIIIKNNLDVFFTIVGIDMITSVWYRFQKIPNTVFQGGYY